MKFLVITSSSESVSRANRQGGFKQLSQQQNQTLNNHFILNHPNIRVFCDCCRKNITLMTFVMADNNQYCIACFIKFEEFPETYHIYERLSYCLTNENWMTLDQILLLTGFQKWGFGNWGEIKDFMGYNGANFSKEQLRSHYDTYYLQNEMLLPKITEDIIGVSRNHGNIREFRKVQIQDKLNQPIRALKRQSINDDFKDNSSSIPKKNQPTILGYNPKRKTFVYDVDYDEKAEALLSDLEFRDDDTPEQTQLKYQILENFNQRQTERIKRYQFTIQHHILDVDYRFKQEISANKYQKEAFNMFKKFTRFQTHEENQQTKFLIAKTSYLKSMIQGLRRCRKKLDQSGQISSTLQQLKKKDSSLQKFGAPRKIYHVDNSNNNNNNETELLKNLSELIKSESKEKNSEKPVLSVIYRSKQLKKESQI